jgi:hypothetical protein
VVLAERACCRSIDLLHPPVANEVKSVYISAAVVFRQRS